MAEDENFNFKIFITSKKAALRADFIASSYRGLYNCPSGTKFINVILLQDLIVSNKYIFQNHGLIYIYCNAAG